MKAPTATKHGKKLAKKQHKVQVKSLADALHSQSKTKPSNSSKDQLTKKTSSPKSPWKDKKTSGSIKSEKDTIKPEKKSGGTFLEKNLHFVSKSKKTTGNTSDGVKRKAHAKAEPQSYDDLKKLRQSQKPNFVLIEKLKSDWNKVRERNTSPELRLQLIESMMNSVKGHIVEITLRHDASRVIQYLLQFGNQAQQHAVLTELVVKAVEICKTPYGHFVVLKAVSYCTDNADRKKLMHCLAGHFVAIGGNVIGARTVESVLQLLSPKLTRSLRAEFYGRKFITLLSEPPSSLRSLIEQLPGKEMPILDHMKDLVQRFVDKGLLEFTYVHNLLWEYTQEIVTKPTYMSDLVNQLLDSAPKLMSTKPGAKVMCVVATCSGAKERKRLIKSLKGKVLESLLHPSAHLTIMRLIDVTDDTINVQKSLLDEIKSVEPIVKYKANGDIDGTPYPALISIATHYFGRKLLLRLLNPSKRHLEPEEDSLFTTEVPTSKKSFESRRNENLIYLRYSLVTVCSRYAHVLLRCKNGSKVLEEVIHVFRPVVVLRAIVQVLSRQEISIDDYATDDAEYNEATDGQEYNEEMDEEMDDVEEDDEEEEPTEEAADEDADMVEVEEDETFLEAEHADDEDDVEVAAIVEPQLDIEEDPIAHAVLKSALRMQAVDEGVTPAAATHLRDVDKSMWEESEFSLSASLLEALEANSLVETWVVKNRPCFALVDALHVPSSKEAVHASLAKHVGLIRSEEHAGGKKLLETLVTATELSKKEEQKETKKRVRK